MEEEGRNVGCCSRSLLVLEMGVIEPLEPGITARDAPSYPRRRLRRRRGPSSLREDT